MSPFFIQLQDITQSDLVPLLLSICDHRGILDLTSLVHYRIPNGKYRKIQISILLFT